MMFCLLNLYNSLTIPFSKTVSYFTAYTGNGLLRENKNNGNAYTK